jgi:hypothetical protein
VIQGLGLSGVRLREAAVDLARNETLTRLVGLGDDAVRACSRPNESLYPFQWNWDSSIVSMGYADLGATDRALAELVSLHSAQHPSGLLPHIAFSDDAASLARYFPGPDVWGDLRGIDGRAISGITQPPVSGIALGHLAERGLDVQSPIVRDLIERIHAHHQWWMRARNPMGDGNVVVLHGWSTGRDNAPEVLTLYSQAHMPARVGVGALRKDLGHGVAASSRPTDWYYERAVGIADTGVALGGWDDPTLAARMPMQLSDPMVAALLAGSAHDLATVAERAGMHRIAEESTQIADEVAGALRRRASSDGTIHALDVRAGRIMDEHLTIATPMTSWAPGMPDEVIRRNAQLVKDGELAGEHGVLSASRTDEFYDAARYWQGPSWPHMDELISQGLRRAAAEPGRGELARREAIAAADALDERVARAIEADGVPEYRHAETGVGVGKRGMSFSSAAMIMHARRTGAEGLDEALAAWRAQSPWEDSMHPVLAPS